MLCSPRHYPHSTILMSFALLDGGKFMLVAGFSSAVLVEGRSMMPVLQPGKRCWWPRDLTTLRSVVALTPFKKTLLIKRLAELRPDGWLVGINESGTDSSLGVFAEESVLGVVTLNLGAQMSVIVAGVIAGAAHAYWPRSSAAVAPLIAEASAGMASGLALGR